MSGVKENHWVQHRCVLSFWRRTFCFLLVAVCLTLPWTAFAQENKRAQKEVPFFQNYSAFELGLTGVAGVGAVVLIGFGHDIFGDPIPSMGTPDQRSVDWRFTHWANPNPDPEKQWLGGTPDYAGYAMPALALGFYGLGTIGAALSDDFFMDSRKHELAAYAGSIGWTMLTINALKLMVGRNRPFTVRDDIDKSKVNEPAKEQVISFPSGHSASAAATMTFVFMDLSDYLVREVFAESNGAVKFTVGRLLPGLVASGLTWTVMYSRIKDQRHWLSDTLVGAMIGAGFSTLFYTMHFDELGNPRKNHTTEGNTVQTNVAPMISPMGHAGMSFGLVW